MFIQKALNKSRFFLNAFHFSNGVKNSLSDAMEIFKLPLFDLVTRQSFVLDQLALPPFGKLGLALGKGSLRNFLSKYYFNQPYLNKSLIFL